MASDLMQLKKKKIACLKGRRQNENFSFYNEVIMDCNIGVKLKKINITC